MHKAIAGLFAATLTAISAPVVTVTPGYSEVQVTWDAPTSPVDYVVVQESTNAGANWKQIAQLPGLSTSYLADSLNNGSKYWFRVQFLSKGIPSDPSRAVLAMPNGAPDAPTSLTAVGGDTQVSLQWDPLPQGSSTVGFGIDLSTDGGNTWSSVIENTRTPANHYLVEDLKNNQSYSFRVRAIGFDGTAGDWSNPTSVLIGHLVDNTFTLDGAVKDNAVALSWSKPEMADTLDTYRLEVSTDGGHNWYKISERDAGILSATVPYVLGGATYRIVATSITGGTAISEATLVQIVDDPNAVAVSNNPNANVMNPLLAGPGTKNANGGSKIAEGGAITTVNGGVGSRSTLPPYNIQARPQRALDTSVASLALLGLISGAASAASRASRRNEDEIAALESIDYDDLERIEGFEEYGDRSKSWRWPNVAWTIWAERFTHVIATQVNRISPLAGRMAMDGSYLRAMYGVFSLLTWISALGLGVLTILETHGQALPPKPLTVLALIAIGTLDAGAGLLASLVVLIGTAALGGFTNLPEARTTIGLSLMWIAPALIAAAARPLRRPRPITFEGPDQARYQWERAGDFVVGPLLAGFTVRTLIQGLPALAGLHLPLANYATQFSLLTIFFVLLRYGLEEQASNNYPMRLRIVETHELRETYKALRHVAIAIRLILFVLVALPFVGSSWQLYAGAAMFIAPSLITSYAKNLPQLPSLTKILPTRVPQFTLVLTIGAIVSASASTLFKGEATARWGFLLLSIPTFAFAILNGFIGKREGEDYWFNRALFTWVYRIGAIFVIGAAIFLAIK